MDAPRPAGLRASGRTPTHYERLQVSSEAPPEVIRAAYRALASLYHPDRRGAQPTDGDAMAAINAAYAVLSDPAGRAAYDAQLRIDAAARSEPDQRRALLPLLPRRRRILRALRRRMERHPLRWTAGAGSAALVTVAGSVWAWWAHQQAQAEQAVLRAWQAAAVVPDSRPAAHASGAGGVLLPSGGAAPEPVVDIGADLADSGAEAVAAQAASAAPGSSSAEEARPATMPSPGDLAAAPTAAGPPTPDTFARAAQAGGSAETSPGPTPALRADRLAQAGEPTRPAAAPASAASAASGRPSTQSRKSRLEDERPPGSPVAASQADAQELPGDDARAAGAEPVAPANEAAPPGAGRAATPLPARPAPVSPALDAYLPLRSAIGLSLPR